MFLVILPQIIIIYVSALLSMAFFTLLERKILGYIQYRKGPNKVSLLGIPQPFADAIKLFAKEEKLPRVSNSSLFLVSPILALTIALIIWRILPIGNNLFFLPFRVLAFLCVSSFSVYATLATGWSSNSKYSLLGALRSTAQTISYEIRMVLIILSPLIILRTYTLNKFTIISFPLFFVLPTVSVAWIISLLAETNRSPFDFAEGESELVSGFNTEYSSGSFALIFISEYASILAISLLTRILVLSFKLAPPILLFPLITSFIGSIFIWLRGTLPRIRYDKLIRLTWKCFLPFSLISLIIYAPITILYRAGRTDNFDEVK